MIGLDGCGCRPVADASTAITSDGRVRPSRVWWVVGAVVVVVVLGNVLRGGR